MILSLPILIIGVVGVLQFGVFFANAQVLNQACRVGALEASHQTLAAAIPSAVTDAIDHQLAPAGITRCYVRMEHNVGGGTTVVTNGTCTCGPTTNLSPTPAGDYVRITVCVEVTDLMPNALQYYGLDFSNQHASCTTVYRVE